MKFRCQFSGLLAIILHVIQKVTLRALRENVFQKNILFKTSQICFCLKVNAFYQKRLILLNVFKTSTQCCKRSTLQTENKYKENSPNKKMNQFYNLWTINYKNRFFDIAYLLKYEFCEVCLFSFAFFNSRKMQASKNEAAFKHSRYLLTPPKLGKSATMQTLPSIRSLKHSKITQIDSLQFDSSKRLIPQYQTDRNTFRMSFINEIDPTRTYENRENYLLNLQKCFLPSYHFCKKQKATSFELQQKIIQQERINKLKKDCLRNQKEDIENVVLKIKKEKAEKIRKKQKSVQEIKRSISKVKSRIHSLQKEICTIQAGNFCQNNDRRKRNYKQQSKFYLRKSYLNSPEPMKTEIANKANLHPMKIEPYAQNYFCSPLNPFSIIQEHFINFGPPENLLKIMNQNLKSKEIFNRTQSNSKYASKQLGNINLLLSQALINKFAEDSSKQRNIFFESKEFQENISKNWQNLDEEKDIIEILEKSENKNKTLNEFLNNFKEKSCRNNIEASRKNIELSNYLFSKDEQQKNQQSPTFKYIPEINYKSQTLIQQPKRTQISSELFGSCGQVKRQNTEIFFKQLQTSSLTSENIMQIQLISNRVQSSSGSTREVLSNKNSKRNLNTVRNQNQSFDASENLDNGDQFSINILQVNKVLADKKINGSIFEKGFIQNRIIVVKKGKEKKKIEEKQVDKEFDSMKLSLDQNQNNIIALSKMKNKNKYSRMMSKIPKIHLLLPKRTNFKPSQQLF